MQNSTMCNSTICEAGLVTKYPMLNLKQLTKDSILLIYISGLHIYIYKAFKDLSVFTLNRVQLMSQVINYFTDRAFAITFPNNNALLILCAINYMALNQTSFIFK